VKTTNPKWNMYLAFHSRMGHEQTRPGPFASQIAHDLVQLVDLLLQL